MRWAFFEKGIFEISFFPRYPKFIVVMLLPMIILFVWANINNFDFNEKIVIDQWSNVWLASRWLFYLMAS